MMSKREQANRWVRRLVLAVPYVWLAVFFLIPFFIVLKISLSETALAQPPYVPVFDLSEGLRGLVEFFSALSLKNYALIASDWLYLESYLKSLQIAAFSTAILLLIGFPIAYGMARAPRRLQGVLFMLVVLPFWTSFLIRIYAWINVLQRDGLLNQALLLCLDQCAAARWPAQSGAPCARHRRYPAGVALDRHRRLHRHRLFLLAVHGVADLCHARENG
jgi:putrescine transport system permease protein